VILIPDWGELGIAVSWYTVGNKVLANSTGRNFHNTTTCTRRV